jgi:hypothetical protein
MIPPATTGWVSECGSVIAPPAGTRCRRSERSRRSTPTDYLRAELSRLTHSVEHRDGGYLKVTLTPEYATLSNLEFLDDLLRRYGFEAIDEPTAR